MRKLLLFYFFINPISQQAQERFEVKQIGFSMDAPVNWLEVENKEVLQNLENFDFTEEERKKMLSSNNSANELVTYYKYHPSKFNGIIPTIKIRTRNVNSKTIAEFLKVIEASNNEASKTLKNFEYQSKPEVITISGKEVVSFSVKFLLSHNGKESSVVSKSYYVLKNGYYISINFIEELNKEKNDFFFDELLDSIRLN
jgi:hypothetical protein